MVGPGVLAGVARVLVLCADRLDEADRLQAAVAPRVRGRADELSLVAQVAAHRGPPRRRGEVVERLVVNLKQLARTVRAPGAARRVRVRARRPVAVGPPWRVG